jgi:DNA-binding winged helix-turn-helix (wHTH) protein
MSRGLYRFGDFELNAHERLLRKGSCAVSIPPKHFDALLKLVAKADRLVLKNELAESLWPDTFVSDTNLTNIIVQLRRLLGRTAIQTVSKHGYRFALPVQGDTRNFADDKAMLERFARAKGLTEQRSQDSIEAARTLLLICLAENPSFASAWAWLGRCCWLNVKFRGASKADQDLAAASFQRAFALDPDLAVTHQFFTMFEVDSGFARDSMTRLRQRLLVHPDEPETLSGLVQVLRLCGLLDESIELSKTAREIDPAIITSAPHTHFLKCDYRATLETYGGRSSYYLDAAAWAALGETQRARKLLTERLLGKSAPPSSFIAVLMRSLNSLLAGRKAESASLMRDFRIVYEPEGMFYFARHYSQMGMTDEAFALVDLAAKAGFQTAPETLMNDPALAALRKHARYSALLRTAQKQVKQARSRWNTFCAQNAS